ncbi:zf-RVT domain-containing protein [Abeliophyllum distichum]|uniref:Zf-RVT domain-containing protein n=1 Tax=Abeliophyllum distichum TaxID=126358 RepID=A0ABD1V4G6_9LAMI
MGESTLTDQHPHLPHSSIYVRDLFDDTGWIIDRLLLPVPYIIAEKKVSISITINVHDQIMWKDTSDSRFATKSAWHLVPMGHTIQAIYIMIWSLYYPTTVSFFSAGDYGKVLSQLML